MSTPQSILVVDHDLNLCDLLEHLLQREYQVIVVHSAEAALAWLQHSRANIILCDVHLPGISGYELIQRLRANETSGSPVVLMSGWEDGKCEQKALEAGAAAFLPKPFLVAELREVLNRSAHRLEMAA